MAVVLQSRVQSIQSPSYGRQILSAIIGKRKASWQTLEQFDTHASFERPDMLSHSAVRYAEFVRGKAEIEMTSRGFKGLERIQGRQPVQRVTLYPVDFLQH